MLVLSFSKISVIFTAFLVSPGSIDDKIGLCDRRTTSCPIQLRPNDIECRASMNKFKFPLHFTPSTATVGVCSDSTAAETVNS